MWKPSLSDGLCFQSSSFLSLRNLPGLDRVNIGLAASSYFVVFAGGELAGSMCFSDVNVYQVSNIDMGNFTQYKKLTLANPKRGVRVSVVADRFFFFIGGGACMLRPNNTCYFKMHMHTQSNYHFTGLSNIFRMYIRICFYFVSKHCRLVFVTLTLDKKPTFFVEENQHLTKHHLIGAEQPTPVVPLSIERYYPFLPLQF